jgi:coproporphyrinogen III oxidase-like Fe-S oxidoreductase
LTLAPAGVRPAALTALDQPPVALYIHVPFCVSHCPYCDFVVVAGREARGPTNRIGAFVAAVEVELGLRADALDARWGRPLAGTEAAAGAAARAGTRARAGAGARPALDSLYLGGGTPSLLPAASITRLLAIASERFGLAQGAEITLEVNPGADERGDARALRAAGVTRLSIGAQSLDPAELRALGRRHSPDDVAATVRAARDADFESLGVDLLYDIPGGSLATWQRTVDAVLDLKPDHLSLYALTLDDPDAEGLTGVDGDHLPVRDGARRWRERARRDQDDDRAAAMYELADDRLAAAGLDWYEISNWCRPGHASRHNQAYWQGEAWEAVGPGAHAFDGETRRWNAARLDGYLAALTPDDRSAARLPPGGREPGEPADRESEAAILALRTRAGLAAAALGRPAVGPSLAWALGERLLERTSEDRLVLTRAGRLLSNELFARLV